MSRPLITILFICLLSATALRSQQTPSFGEYNYNPFLVNPAYAGAMPDSEAVLSNSGMGATVEGAPATFSLTYNTPIKRNQMGLGAAVINDQIGVTRATQAYLAYSYKVILNANNYPYWKVFDRTFLSFGLTGGVLSYNEDLLSLGLENDPNFSGNINSTLPTAGAGILFGSGNFFGGISVPNLLGDTFANQDQLELNRPIYSYAGYYLSLDRFHHLFLKPSGLIKFENGAPLQADFNLFARLSEQIRGRCRFQN